MVGRSGLFEVLSEPSDVEGVELFNAFKKKQIMVTTRVTRSSHKTKKKKKLRSKRL